MTSRCVPEWVGEGVRLWLSIWGREGECEWDCCRQSWRRESAATVYGPISVDQHQPTSREPQPRVHVHSLNFFRSSCIIATTSLPISCVSRATHWVWVPLYVQCVQHKCIRVTFSLGTYVCEMAPPLSLNYIWPYILIDLINFAFLPHLHCMCLLPLSVVCVCPLHYYDYIPLTVCVCAVLRVCFNRIGKPRSY